MSYIIVFIVLDGHCLIHLYLSKPFLSWTQNKKKSLSQPLPVSKADSGNKKLSHALNIEIANILPF